MLEAAGMPWLSMSMTVLAIATAKARVAYSETFLWVLEHFQTKAGILIQANEAGLCHKDSAR